MHRISKGAKIFHHRWILLILCIGLFWSHAFVSYASANSGEPYVNPDTNYQVVIEDDASLLTEEEAEMLKKDMEVITTYGNVVFKTISVNSTSTNVYAEQYYHDTFGQSSGILFLIDMDNRNIWIFSDGAIYKTVTKSYANTVTDNVYTYARRGEYYLCAKKAFEQVDTLLKGQKIAQPMKYIGNLLLAVAFALLINFMLMVGVTRVHRRSSSEMLKAVNKRFSCTNPTVSFSHETKRYDPVERSSGGGGGGGHSGGGGGGGGHSGGGGGHSF